MGLDRIETLHSKDIFTEGIPPPEWMSRHTDPLEAMDNLQYPECVRVVISVPSVSGIIS